MIVPTSVHIPARLLEALDRHAQRLGVSRNRLIVRALEHELERTTSWTPGFFERLVELDARGAEEVEAMRTAIHRGRTRKDPLPL